MGKIDNSSDTFLVRTEPVKVKQETVPEIHVDNMLAQIINNPEDIHREIAIIVHVLNRLIQQHNYNVENDGL